MIKDIIVRDPFFLAVRPIGCEDLLIDNIKIIGCWRYNSDGIDLINCKNGLIKNCFVRSFDDSICLKGFCYPYIDEMTYNGKVFDIMENITVSNCVVWNEWGKALEIGVDICANEVRNCKFENCDVIHASYSVMDISNVDYADIHNITFQNIRVECEKGELLPVMQTEENEIYDISCERSYPKLSTVLIYYTDEYSSKGDKRGKVHDVLFKDIYIYADKMLESTIHGFSKEYCVNNIVYENISFNGMQISDKDDLRLETGEFAQNIVFK